MVKTKTELLEKLKLLLGENTSEDALSLFEDLSDTVDDYENRTADGTNWKERFEENDKAWAQRYRDRFFSPVEAEKGEPIVEEKELTYDNLFTEGKEK